MADHPNVELFRRAYAAFTTANFDALAEVFDENTVWHQPGQNPLSGDHVGRDATFASFAKEFELSGGTYAPTVHDVLANDEHIVALMHSTAEREGRSSTWTMSWYSTSRTESSPRAGMSGRIRPLSTSSGRRGGMSERPLSLCQFSDVPG